jgi:hypothetical protein
VTEQKFNWQDGVSLREYVEFRLCAIQQAIDKSEKILNVRLEAMNEFRDALKDQSANFLTKEAYDAKHTVLQNQVDDLRLSKATLDGKASAASVYVGYAIALIGIILAILSYAHSL